MALSRRTGARFQASIWPGFVDAMTGLLLVLMFVLTIFMVLQFVLQERITGQENELSERQDEIDDQEAELNELSVQVLALASALGLSQDRAATLDTQVDAASSEITRLQSALGQSEGVVSQQTALIAQLSGERDISNANLADAAEQITGFEAQVAGLLAQQRDAEGAISALRTREADLLTSQDALNLALAQARSEIDVGVENARLAAARRDALEAMIAGLEADGTVADEQISALEARQIVDSAAADALRARLENAGSELTAMTLALEEQRRDAENTLTLLAAAEAARGELDAALALAFAAGQEAQAEAQVLNLEAAELSDQLTAAVAALASARVASGEVSVDLDRQTALLAQANVALSQEEALSAQSRREVALLNEQVAALSGELGRLQALLDLENEADAAANVQIDTLTQDLNTAMARALVAERRANVLEVAEIERLAAEAIELERFRSDFLGLLRGVLEDVDGVRIQGDRFVFSSEVLFEQGAAELSDLGRGEIAKVAAILRDVADEIPAEIDWVIRVDGHTDNVPLSGLGEFANNWELSQARALSVVLFMVDSEGIPPERLAANGFGQYQPIDPRDSNDARAQNRRIELKLTER